MILEEVEKAAQAMIDAKEMEKLMAISSMRMGSGGSAVGGEGKVTESKVAKDAKDPDAVSDDGRINLRPASRVQKKEKGSFKKSKQSTFPVNPRAEGAPRAEGEEKEDSSDAGVLEGLQKKELVKTPAAESA